MSLDDLRRNWDGLGKVDPLWAILAYPERHKRGWEGHEDDFFATGRQAVDEVMKMLDRVQASPATKGRAMDFGCGAGRLTQGLAGHFEKADGVDIASSMVDLARKHNRAGDRVTYHLNEKSDLSLFEDDTFDFLLSIIVLQHIPNAYKTGYLREFVRVLEPGGVAAFTVPSHGDWSIEGIVRRLPNSWQNVYRRRRYGYDNVMEFHPLKRAKVEATLREAGAEVVHVEREYMAGPRYTSFMYVIRKPAASTTTS
ncbi:ubiquinone biosynthesis protein [Knoellia sinensis KCTC 19936]|uniref:Ubiquinone biosynthesis protein n=1 Tax=Knoellia sinensis KCTC 19936 TaxID=1385520 RepID=A0A0A0JAD6_9MICO|nr:class I SAM-dependent methyltransferase [Knoellia sinensis]KGN32541.1 ubiquinone biosynthesis protein [Knoellia sinensis KCTC 19936]